MKASLLTVAAIIALTGTLVSCGDSEEVAPDVTPAASTAAPTIPATPTLPSGLPTPAAGYVWWVAPPLSADAAGAGLRRYAVQVPSDWSQPQGSYLAGVESFVPPGATGGKTLDAPVAVPQLLVIVSAVTHAPPDSHPGWKHPFVWEVGQQGGGGCSGDVSATSATPSSTYTAAGYLWDVFTFKCHVEQIGSPPGSTYDGRAGEARVGDVIFAIVLFQLEGTDSLQPVLQRALESLTPQ